MKCTALALIPLAVVIFASSADAGEKEFPPVTELPDNKDLPDPWLFFDGTTRVKTYEDWAKRREELKALFKHYEYGDYPPLCTNATATIESEKPMFGGKATLYEATIRMGPDMAVSGHIDWLVPKGKGPFPLILHTGYALTGKRTKYNVVAHPTADFMEKVIDRGYVAAQWYCYEYDEEGKKNLQVRKAFPKLDVRTLTAWGWSAGGIIGYLGGLPYVDAKKCALEGNSRRGKAALWAGVNDDRIAIAVPSCSGAGGNALFRYQGSGSETLKRVQSRFPHWFAPRFKGFADNETKLPFDQHLLRALVAPRAVLHCDGNNSDDWANQEGGQESYRAAQHVYDWLQVKNANGFYVHKEGHGWFENDWYCLMDFADKYYFDKDPASGRKFNELQYPAVKLYSWVAPPIPKSSK